MTSEGINEIMGAAQLLSVDIGELHKTEINYCNLKDIKKVPAIETCIMKNDDQEESKLNILKAEGMRMSSSEENDFPTLIDSGFLKRQIQRKHEDVRYPCGKCDFTATRKTYLKEHIASLHEGMCYPCSQCEYKTGKKGNLRKHVESVHEGVCHPCSQCDHNASW